MKTRLCAKAIGIGVFAFGLGILISFFIPDAVLVIIEAAVIVALGVLCYLKSR